MNKQIQINNYIFTLRGKLKGTGGRDLVKVSSQHISLDIKRFFILYRSNSDGGIWRFCIQEKSGYLLKYSEKISDYITVTFVHIDLQNFINKYYDKLDLIKENEPVCYYYYKDPERNTYDTIYKEVFSETRYKDLEVFKPLTVFKCGSVLQVTKKKDIEKQITKLEKLPKTYYTGYMLALIDMFFEDKEEDKYATKLFKQFNVNVLDRYLNHFFNYDAKSIKTIGTFNFKLKDKSLNYVYKQINITLNNNNPKEILEKNKGLYFTVLYADYTYTDKLSKKYTGKYNIILNIIPSDAVINRYGLYSDFITAGYLICKPIEYIIQSPWLKDPERNIDSTYKFIGDTAANVWFLKNIKYFKGGFKDKYLKYKQKYLMLKNSILEN